MAYRLLTVDERVAYVAANAAIVEWEAIRQLALKLFGPAVRAVEAVINWQYVDEEGSILQRPRGITDLLAFDAGGNALQPDFSLPIWQARATFFDPDRPVAGRAAAIADVIGTECQTLDPHLIQGLDDVDELDMPSKRYNLTQPPLTEMALYVLQP